MVSHSVPSASFSPSRVCMISFALASRFEKEELRDDAAADAGLVMRANTVFEQLSPGCWCHVQNRKERRRWVSVTTTFDTLFHIDQRHQWQWQGQSNQTRKHSEPSFRSAQRLRSQRDGRRRVAVRIGAGIQTGSGDSRGGEIAWCFVKHLTENSPDHQSLST